MSRPYAIFLKQPVHGSLATIRGNRRRLIESFFDFLSKDPFEEGDFSETDRDGRTVFCKIVGDYAISYCPDHPAKEVKVIELVKTP